MKISIITVCYNSVNTIERTIKSVLNQDYPDFEYIIVDGDSNDGTLDIIKKYQESIILISEPDNGIYDAMNKGINIATGEIIATLNSDDCYHSSNVLSRIALKYKKLNQRAIIHGNLLYIDGNSEKVKKPDLRKDRLLRGPVYFQPTMFVPKVFYNESGLLDVRYKIAADYELMLRFYLERRPFVYIDEIITEMYSGGESDNKVLQGYRECYQITLEKKINKLTSTYSYLKRCVFYYIDSLF